MEIAFKNRKDKSGFAKAWVLHRKRAAFTVQKWLFWKVKVPLWVHISVRFTTFYTLYSTTKRFIPFTLIPITAS